MPTQVIMPQLGESVVEGTVTRWLKAEGDRIEEMESLLEVNTDKVDTEIPSPAGGVVLKLLVPEGQTVKAGTVIALIGEPGETAPSGTDSGGSSAPETAEAGAGASAQALQETAAPPQAQPDLPPARPAAQGDGNGQKGAAPPVSGRSRELGFISPVVARIAQEHNLDLSQVTGTGEGGRITKKDVLAYLEQSQAAPAAQAEPAPWETPGEGDLFRPTELMFPQSQASAPASPAGAPQPAPQPALSTRGQVPGEGEILQLSPMRRRIAEHMVVSKRTSPHVTTVMEADLNRVIAHYNTNKAAFTRSGARLTYTAYFVAAAIQALRAFPIVNSSWTDEGVLIHPQVNIGLAVSLGEEGLIVPVLKGGEGLSLLGLARAVNDLADRARSRKLQPDDVQGGTFTITNHGISGSLFATPVINQPQCGILGVGAVQKRVVVVTDNTGADSIAIRPMVYLSLTFDHRILDGAAADGFLAKVVDGLENWQ